MNNVTFGDDTFAYYETVAGGAGAVSVILTSVLHFLFVTVAKRKRVQTLNEPYFLLFCFKGPSWHGRSGVHTHMTNTRITDPEILEKR